MFKRLHSRLERIRIAGAHQLQQSVAPSGQRQTPARTHENLASQLAKLLAESRTPTELCYRLQELSTLNAEDDRLVQQQVQSLKSLPLRDRWLANLERTAPQTVSHADREDARDGQKKLEEMLAQPWWQPYASLQTPVFARAQQRLMAVAQRNHAERGGEEHH